MTYTEKIHVIGLLNMLERKKGLAYSKYRCPAKEAENVFNLAAYLPREVCPMCAAFVGGTEIGNRGLPICPCNYYGRTEAVKRTWIALEEKGYI